MKQPKYKHIFITILLLLFACTEITASKIPESTIESSAITTENQYCFDQNYLTVATGSDNFLVGINTIGDTSKDQPQSSGVLPGTSPSISEVPSLMYDKDGRPIPNDIPDRFFPPLDPGVIKQAKLSILEKARHEKPEVKVYALGEQKQFWVKDDKDTNWRQVTATNKRIGDHSLIFVDDTLSIPDEPLDLYVTEFETMYKVILDNIGDFDDRDGNDKVSILLYSFNDGGSINLYMGGYFSPKDYLTQAEAAQYNLKSNEMDIIYMRGNIPTGWEQIGYDFYNANLTTLVHEYQHLVHFCELVWQDGNPNFQNFDDVWINEMMSMASETMYFKKKLSDNPSFEFTNMAPGGYLSRRILYYNTDGRNSIRNGHGLCYWDNNGDVLANYSLSYLFGQYLAIQSQNGQGVFKNILDYMLANNTFNYNAVVGVAKEKISGITSWEDLLHNWAIANMANEPSGTYGYNGQFALTPHGPTGSTASIHNSGAVYRNITGPVDTPSRAGRYNRFYTYLNGQVTALPAPTGGFCVGSLLAGRDVDALAALRGFRDGILLNTPAGRDYVKLFYKHSFELSVIFMSDPALQAQAEHLLYDVLPQVTAALNRNEFTIDNALIDELNFICDSVKAKSSTELYHDITSLQKRINAGTLCAGIGLNCHTNN